VRGGSARLQSHCRGDARGRLGRQIELELLHEEFLISVQFGVAAQNQRAAIGGREVHVEHLDGSKLVEHGPRCEAADQPLEFGVQRDVQTAGDEGDEDVRFDAMLKLVLEILEGGLDLDSRVEDWRAGLGRCLYSPFLALSFASVTLSRPCHVSSPFHVATQHADFLHYAPPLASPQGLWDLSRRGSFRSVASHSIAVEQLQSVVQQRSTPPLPAEALSFLSVRQVAPDSIFDVAEALT
jgi:hypothetical protein